MRDLPPANEIVRLSSEEKASILEPFDVAILEFTHPFQRPNVGFLENNVACFITKAALKWPIIIDYIRIHDEKNSSLLMEGYVSYLSRMQSLFDRLQSFLLFIDEVPEIYHKNLNIEKDKEYDNLFSILSLNSDKAATGRRKGARQAVNWNEIVSSAARDFREIAPPQIPGDFVRERVNRVKYLEDNGYIIDPFIETFSGVAVAVLGIIPYSYSKRTETGDKILLEIKALLWELEHERDGDKRRFEVHFKMMKLVAALKVLLKKIMEQDEAAADPRKPSESA